MESSLHDEMRMRLNESSRKEVAFKASSKKQSENLDDEEVICIKKLEKGTRKYKGNLPLKCCNCGRIGHFASKCTYPKQYDNDERELQSLKRVNHETRKSPMRKRKLFTPWMIVRMHIQVKMKKHEFY